MFTTMGSGPVTLLVCSVIAVAIAYPFEQQLLTAQDSGYSLEHRSTDQRPITYRKRFHFFAAPEEDEGLDEEVPEELLKQNINVVVIKAPENNKATSTIARLAKTLAEEKTAIYVLNKEPDLREITTHIERFKDQKITRPEVHFIKYKTAEEADLAARNIQVGYDSLTGPSEVEHQVTAALHSYVGLLEGGGVQEMQLVSFYGRPLREGHSFLRTSPEAVTKQAGVGETEPASQYLPPNGEAAAPAEVIPVEENISESENPASGSGSSFYLPPQADSTTVAPLEEIPPTVSTRAPRVRSDFVKQVARTNVLNPRPGTVTEKLITSTASPARLSSVTTTRRAGRGSFRYTQSETATKRPTTASRTTTINPNDSVEDLSLVNKYLPPSETKLRNKRLK